MKNKIKIKRIARGSLALFALKIFLICSFVIVQACKDSVSPEDPTMNFSSFLSSERMVILDRINLDANHQVDDISESEAQELMSKTLKESKLLLSYFGFEEEEFKNESGKIDDIVIIFTALAVFEAENRFEKPNVYTASLFFNEAKAYDSVGTCLLEAIGVGALYDWAVGKSVVSRRVLIRAVGKALSRTLGYVGTALAVVDFVWCMNREQ